MTAAVNIFLLLLLLTAAAVSAAWVLSYELTPEPEQPQLRRWLLRWSGKGLLAPMAIWALMNVGLSWNLQPFMPQVQAAQNSGSGWFPVYLRVVGTGLFVIGSYWAAVTLGWVLVEAGVGSEKENRAQFKRLCLTCVIGLGVPALLLVYFGGWSMLGLASLVLLAPMAGYGSSILKAKTQKLPPMYARAIARMKFGKYSEAEWEIIRELERCEDDFEGWMMLAGLYANNFNDLPEAEHTVLEICEQPTTTPSQVSIGIAPARELAFAGGRPGGGPPRPANDRQPPARHAPGAHGPAPHQPTAHLGGRTAPATERGPNSPARPGRCVRSTVRAPESATDRRHAAEEANACVEILKADPNNVHARERLARLFAERLDKPELGIEQVKLLLDLPDQPDSRRADWLGLIAAWHIRYRHDSDAGRKFIEQLIREFPNSPQAMAARRRIQLLDRKSRK